MSIKLPGATNGSIELDVPASCGSDLSVTIPAIAGEILVADASGDVETSATGTGGSSGSALIVGYQQGTWTPAVVTGTVTTVVGQWTRIGNRVTVDFSLTGFSDTTSGNNIIVNGVPYDRGANDTSVGAIRLKWINFTTVPITATATINSSSNILFYGSIDAGDLESITHAKIVTAEAANAQIKGSLSYPTDDTTWTPINGAAVS